MDEQAKAKELAKANAEAKLAIDSLSLAMQKLFGISGDAAGKIAGISTQIVSLVNGARSAGSAISGVSSALSMGLGVFSIATTVIMGLVDAFQQAKEKQLEFARAAAEGFRESSAELATIERNMSVLRNQSATVEEVTKARAELARLFPNMSAGLDDEGTAILANTEALKRQYNIMKQTYDLQVQVTADSLPALADKYDEVAKKIEDKKSFHTVEIEGANSRIDFAAGTENGGKLSSPEAIKKMERDMNAEIAKIKLESGDLVNQLISSIIADLELQGKQLSPVLQSGLRLALTEAADKGIDSQALSDLANQYADTFTAMYVQLGDRLGNTINDTLFANVTAGVDVTTLSEEQAAKIRESLTAAMDIAEESGVTEESANRWQELYNKVFSLEATDADIAEFDALTLQFATAAGQMKEEMADIDGGAKMVNQSFAGMNITLTQTADMVRLEAIAQKAAKTSYMDAANGVMSLHNSYQNLNKEIANVGSMKAALKLLKEGDKASRDYKNALEWLAQKYGVTEQEAADMAGALEDEIIIKEALIEASLELARSQAVYQQSVVEAMAVSATFTKEAKKSILESLESIVAKIEDTQNRLGGVGGFTIEPGTVPDMTKKPSGSRSGGGGGTKQNTALQNELAELEHKKAMDALVYGEELAWLERIRRDYAKTTDEKRSLDEKIHTAQQALHKENIAAMQAGYDTIEKSATDTLEELQSKGKASQADELRHQEYLLINSKNLANEMLSAWGTAMDTWTQDQLAAYETVQEKIRQTQNQINSLSLASANAVVAALDTALRAAYDEETANIRAVEAAEQESMKIRHSKKLDNLKTEQSKRLEKMKAAHAEALANINAERDARLAAIDAEVAALDDLLKEKDRGDKDAEELKDIGRLQAKIEYEANNENRAAMEKKLEELQKSRNDRLFKQEIEDKKAALKEEQTLIKEQYTQEIAALKEKQDTQLEMLKAQQEKALELVTARQDAELKSLQQTNERKLDEIQLFEDKKALIEQAKATGNMGRIMEIIKQYNPQFALTGQDLGVSLVDTFGGEMLARMPEEMAKSLGLLSPESPVGIQAIADSTELGAGAGKAFGDKLASGVSLYIDSVSNYFNSFMDKAEARLSMLISKAQSLNSSGSSGGSQFIRQSSNSAGASSGTAAVKQTTINITTPTPVTMSEALSAANKADREQVLRG